MGNKCSDVIRIAKRYNNNKRKYLLVNTAQAKHIPVCPSVSLKMMRKLGRVLAEKYSDTKLVIGFAETATAIGAVVAECFGKECMYIQTTREEFPYEKGVDFCEEHSHAVNQRIYGRDIFEKKGCNSPIIFVDDELTTGRTLINIVDQLKKEYSSLNSRKLIAASIVNRVDEENECKMAKHGLTNEFLLKSDKSDYSDIIDKIRVREPAVVRNTSDRYKEILLSEYFIDPRLGCNIFEYRNQCEKISNDIIHTLSSELSDANDILVLGTEECMYPSIIVGKAIEKAIPDISVYTHSTTRSPIGISNISGYPIISGYKIPSFYDSNRETYIYNLKKYDAAIVITDSESNEKAAMQSLCYLLNEYKINKVYFVRGANNV